MASSNLVAGVEGADELLVLIPPHVAADHRAVEVVRGCVFAAVGIGFRRGLSSSAGRVRLSALDLTVLADGAQGGMGG